MVFNPKNIVKIKWSPQRSRKYLIFKGKYQQEAKKQYQMVYLSFVIVLLEENKNTVIQLNNTHSISFYLYHFHFILFPNIQDNRHHYNQTMRNILKITTFKTLINSYLKPYSVQNYMKTFTKEIVTRHHGILRTDQYQHLDNDPHALQQFIEKQRQSYEKESQKWKKHTNERDARSTTVAQKYDGYQYYTKVAWNKEREYSVVYRRSLIGEGKQELVLDIMQYPQIKRYAQTVQLIKTSFSPSHRYVGFGVDLKNNQNISFFIADTHNNNKKIVDFKTNQETETHIKQVQDMIFTSEKQVYYLKVQNHRPCRLIYHNLENGQIQQMLYEEDPQIYLHIRVSKDKKYLLLTGSTKQRSKIWLVNLTEKRIKPRKVWQESSQVYLNHVEDHFIMWMKGQTSVVKLIEDKQLATLRGKPQGDISIKNCNGQAIYTCADDETIEDIDIVKNCIVLYMQSINKPLLKLINYHREEKTFRVDVNNAKLPYQFGVISPGTNQNYQTDEIVFFMSTPFVFEQVYSYSLTKKQYSTVQKYEYTGPNFPTKKYQIVTLNVPSTTSDYIPLTIIGPKKRAPGKMLIHFYGFYGIPTRVGYDNVSIAALEKGWTIAYAHIRGGGQKGHKWHKQALGQNRDRTWKDLEQCVGFLIRQKYTHPSLLFLQSHSAGAIALWNAINHKPHLYKGAIFRFPFMDVLSSLLDKTQPLSNTDYEQFGNPIVNKLSYRQIEAISPYQNISNKQYPALHFVAGQNDYRTPVSQVAKFVSRFRDRALTNGRIETTTLATVDISQNASHLGEASVKDQNYKGCDVFGYMDYILQKSKDCSFVSQ